MLVSIPSKTYIRKFRQVDATSAEHARTLADLGLPDTRIFRRMVPKGVFVSCDKGRFYLREAAVRGFVKAERTRLVIGGVILLLLLAAYAVWLVFTYF